MIEGDVYPHYIALGLSLDEIRHYTLSELRFYDDGYKLKRKMRDEIAYFDGFYTYEAVAIAVGNAFRGKGQKPVEYRKKPILWENSEESLQKQREAFVAALETMKTNFELSKQAAG